MLGERVENRVLVHAPRGRDAAVVQAVLEGGGMTCSICESGHGLVECLTVGGAAAVITEEALSEVASGAFSAWHAQQPSWSDFPFIVLATRQAGRRSAKALASLQELGNVILLERPVNAQTLLSAAQAAVRARRRQYATRAHLDEIRETHEVVQKLNTELEDRIVERTKALAAAGDRLMAEVAERERAQAALVQAQKMEALGRLTGGIAHDFNNLLHVVGMNLELVKRLAGDERLKAIAAKGSGAVARAARLTGQLLSFARSQSLLPKLENVNDVIAGMQELLAVSAGSGIAIRLDLCEEATWSVIDANQLEMAVLNLTVNARDAMPAGGDLVISTRVREARGERDLPAGDYVTLSITDTGEGIAPSLLPKVFEPFFTTKSVGSGTGLGLSQVYGFARQSGGGAFVHSDQGSGTTVEMWFPLSRDVPAVTEAPASEPAAAPPARQQRVLVVEDDADVRRVIVECLGLLGYEVFEAPDGPHGLQALQQHRPDLLMVDYAMPHMTGAEVIAQARALVGDIPVILATGYADMADVGRVLATDSILIKPFDIATLSKAVSDALSRPAKVLAAA